MVKILRMVERASLSWAHHVIAPDGIAQKELLESRGVPSSKISIVLNAPDEGVFGQRYPSARDQGSFHLITHGSLIERYDVQTLIRAVPLLAVSIPELQVKVVGDGEYRPRLEELARSLGVEDRVRFTGMVSQEQVAALIAEAHVGVVVIPSGQNPTMPNKLFDYLALGKPIVVTSVPSIRAYLDDNSALFFDPHNEHDLARCVMELYRNPEKRAEMAAASSAIYHKYRWTTMKSEYLKVFEQLLKDLD